MRKAISSMENPGIPEGTEYLVLGLRFNPNPELDGLPSSSVVIVGSFSDLSKAVLCRDIYADLDTTFEAVTITSSTRMEDVPDFDVFLSVTVSEEGVIIRSQCVTSGTEPWLREEEDFFEALAYPEDREDIIRIASEWYNERAGYYPSIIDDISERAQHLID